MPKGVNEATWKRAKAAAAEAGHAEDWPYVMSIYQKMEGGEAEKSFEALTVADLVKAGLGGRPGGPGRVTTQRFHGLPPKRGGIVHTTRIDPEVEAALTRRPDGFTAARYLDTPMSTPDAVVKGLGFSAVKERELAAWLTREARTATEMSFRQGVFQKGRYEGWPLDLLKEFGSRATRFYRESRNLLKAQFEPTGGAFHMRVTKECPKSGKAKHRYYYDEEKYRKDHGTHMTGRQVREGYLKDRTLTMCKDAGDKGCAAKQFADLVKEYGAEDVHAAVDQHVKAGDVVRKKDRFFFARGRKELPKS